MRKQFNPILFHIIPVYRRGMTDVFDYSRQKFGAASLPSQSQRIKQNSLFIDMQNICGNCLDDLDLYYVFATDGDENYAKINWKTLGSFTLSESGTVTHTPDEGFNGNGTNGYLDTGYIASSHGVNYTQNDASAFCAILDNISENRSDFGVSSGGSDPSILLNSRNTLNQVVFRVNTATQTGGAMADSTGFYHLIRASSSNHSLYKNGSLNVSTSQGSSGVPNRTLPLLANNNNGTISSFSTKKMGCFGLGASLTGNEADLYTAWNDYFTSL